MTACPLSLVPGAENAVWPTVPTGADVLCIADAPRREDVLNGRAFSDSSGLLCRSWLRSANLLDRTAFAYAEAHRTYDLTCRRCGIEFWAYTDKYQPALARDALSRTRTQSKFLERWAKAERCDHVWKETKANREPSKTERCGLPVIEKLLRSRRWPVVLCWGAVPARVLGGYKGSVGSMVGRFRTLSAYSDVLCTVLYHPAYALRQKGSPEYAKTESLTKEVLRQVSDRLEHPDSQLGVYPYVELAERAVPALRGTRVVVDIETTVPGKTPDPRVDTPKTLCVGWLDSPDVVLRSLSPADRFVVSPGSRFVMHNAQYDLPLLMRLSGEQDITADDTMVQAYLLGRPALSLKILGRRELGQPAREFLETSGDDPEYAAQDPHLTRDLFHHFKPELEIKGLRFLYEDVKTPLQGIMARHVVRGLAIDQTRVAALHSKMQARADTLAAQLKKTLGRDFNLGKAGTTDEVESIIFDELRIPPLLKWNPQTKEREPQRTTGADHLGQFLHVPFVAQLMAYRRAGGFLKRTAMLASKVRVSGLYNMTGTGTDRVSQSDENCMNFNGLVKQCIEADEGGYFVYGDFSQIELRLAAYFSQDSYLLAVLREGRNMHEELCLAVYGARTPDTYTQAKSSNFAKLFGAGLKRRARTLKMPESVVARTEIAWPGWDAWVASRSREPARTFWGYERNLDDALDSADNGVREKALRQVINSIVQGTAGETNQYAQVLAERSMRQLGGYCSHQEHDSVLCWVPSAIDPEEAKAALLDAMVQAVPQDIRDVIDIPAKVIVGSHWT